MNIYEFATNSPWLALCLTYFILTSCVEYPLKLVNRWIRHRNILAHGWPPAHCDADGDVVTEDSD